METVSAIRFNRWTSAFPGGSFDDNFYKTDRDRFHIRIRGEIPGLTKIRVSSLDTLKTVSGGQYLEKPNGDGTNEISIHKENGDMVSDPILLVSDADDDTQFNGGGGDNGNADATLQAGFDSRIKVEFPELNNTSMEFTAAKPNGRIKVNIAYCSLDGSLPQDKRDLIVLQVLKAKEVYRQMGIDLFVANIWPLKLPRNEPGYEFETFLGADNTLNSVETGKFEYYLTLQTQQASAQEQHPQNPVPSDQIVVGFIDAELTHPDPLQPGHPDGYVRNFSPPAIVSIRQATGGDKYHYTMAHEVGHIVTKEDHPAGAPQERLMVDGRNRRYAHDHNDSKRFILQEENWIRNRLNFYAPLP